MCALSQFTHLTHFFCYVLIIHLLCVVNVKWNFSYKIDLYIFTQHSMQKQSICCEYFRSRCHFLLSLYNPKLLASSFCLLFFDVNIHVVLSYCHLYPFYQRLIFIVCVCVCTNCKHMDSIEYARA